MVPYLLVALVLFGAYAGIVWLLLSGVRRSAEAKADQGYAELRRLSAEYRAVRDQERKGE